MNKQSWKSRQGSAMVSSFLSIFLAGLSIKYFADKSIIMRKTVNSYKVDGDLKYLKKRIKYEVSCEDIGQALSTCDGSPIQLYTETDNGKAKLTKTLSTSGDIAGAGEFLGWYVKTTCEDSALKIRAAKYNPKSKTFREDPSNGRLLDWNNDKLVLYEDKESLCQQANSENQSDLADAGSASTFNRLTFKPVPSMANYTNAALPYGTWGEEIARISYESKSINAELIVDADIIFGGEDHTSDYLYYSIYGNGQKILWDPKSFWVDHTDSVVAQHYQYKLSFPTTPGETTTIIFSLGRQDWWEENFGPISGAKHTDLIFNNLTMTIEEYNE